MPTEVTVKTLDSNQYQFKIPDGFTVREFKEHIANEVNVPWDKQRIIFGGKVLQDDRKLADCHVDKKTVHLVQKLPAFNTSSDSRASTSSSNQGASSRTQQHTGSIHIPLSRSPGTLIVEAIIPPEQIQPGDQIEQIFRQLISTMGSINPIGMGARVGTAAPVSVSSQEVTNRLLTIRALFRMAFNSLNVLEGRPTEVYQVRNQNETFRQPNPPGEAAGAAAAAATTPPAPAAPASSSSSGPNSANTTPRQPNRPFSYLTVQEIRPHREILSRVYQELDCLQDRLRPFLVRYRELLTAANVTADQLNEQQTRQLTSRVAMTLHALSHIQHNLSDIEIDPRRPNQITAGVPIEMMGHVLRGQLNSVAVLSNVPEPGSAQQQQEQQAQQSGSRITVGQAANQASARASGRAGGPTSAIRVEISAQNLGAAPALNPSQTANGSQVSTGTQTLRPDGTATSDATGQPQAAAPLSQLSLVQQQAQQRVQSVFNHFDVVARLSSSALRGASRSSAPTSEAPSREDTTASNTTTNTTDTPTVAGSNMNSGPQPSPATINLTSRILPQGREQFDPYLPCFSPWSHVDRSASRRSASHRSSSAPAPVRTAPAPARRSAESAASANTSTSPRVSSGGAAAAAAAASSAATTDTIDFTFMTNSNFEEVLRMIFPNFQPAELIRSMPFGNLIEWNFEQSAETDFFAGLLRVLLTELQSVDFLQVIFQQRLSLLNSLREPLQNYLRQRLLNGMPPTAELIEARVNEVTGDWSSELPFGISEANLLPGVDVQATLVAFLRTRLATIFNQILSSTADQEEFGVNLFVASRDAVGHACVLLVLCCEDAESLERILDARIRSLDGVYNGPFPSELMRRLRQNASPVSQVDEDALRTFIVRTASRPTATNDDSSRMEVDPPDGANASSAEVASNISPLTQSRGFQVNRNTAPVSHEVALGALQAAAAASAEDSPQSTVWRGVVPSNWAPIIARDLQSQPIQQRPLSDAYIEGMPSKRRRLMKPTNPSKLSNVHASVQEAIQRAGVRPRTSLEAVGADLERNKMKLQDSLQKTIRDRLARRLTEDKDFESDKFPYAKRMAE